MGIVKDYFSFSKRERTGAIVLIILIVGIFALPDFLPSSKKIPHLEAITTFSESSDTLNRKVGNSSDDFSDDDDPVRKPAGKFKEFAGSVNPAPLHYFDPNTLSKAGWMELGISERTAGTIKNFLSKGGSFKKPEDIGKIYGLSREQYDRLLPYVHITAPAIVQQPRWKDEGSDDNRAVRSRSPVTVIDINTADTAMLIALPGIGSKLAHRIVTFRNKMGGFYSIDQVKEVYGLPDSTYQLIRPLLFLTSAIQKININTATPEQLKNHPYLKWNIANAIVNYRNQHGSFEKVDDLLQIDIITPEMLERVKPYLEVD